MNLISTELIGTVTKNDEILSAVIPVSEQGIEVLATLYPRISASKSSQTRGSFRVCLALATERALCSCITTINGLPHVIVSTGNQLPGSTPTTVQNCQGQLLCYSLDITPSSMVMPMLGLPSRRLPAGPGRGHTNTVTEPQPVQMKLVSTVQTEKLVTELHAVGNEVYCVVGGYFGRLRSDLSPTQIMPANTISTTQTQETIAVAVSYKGVVTIYRRTSSGFTPIYDHCAGRHVSHTSLTEIAPGRFLLAVAPTVGSSYLVDCYADTVVRVLAGRMGTTGGPVGVWPVFAHRFAKTEAKLAETSVLEAQVAFDGDCTIPEAPGETVAYWDTYATSSDGAVQRAVCGDPSLCVCLRAQPTAAAVHHGRDINYIVVGTTEGEVLLCPADYVIKRTAGAQPARSCTLLAVNNADGIHIVCEDKQIRPKVKVVPPLSRLSTVYAVSDIKTDNGYIVVTFASGAILFIDMTMTCFS